MYMYNNFTSDATDGISMRTLVPSAKRSATRGPTACSSATARPRLPKRESVLNLCRRTVNLRRPERARNEGSTETTRFQRSKTLSRCCNDTRRVSDTHDARPDRVLQRHRAPAPAETTRTIKPL